MMTRWTILIVDDAPEDRKSYRRYLETATDSPMCSVIEAGSGEEAVDLFKQHHPDCVLVDYHLPDISGFEIMEALQREGSAGTPGIVMLTGAGDTEIAVSALKLGAHDYLDKDALTPGQLRRAVANAIEKVNLHVCLAREREWMKATLTSIGEGLIATDNAGWLLLMNDEAGRLTGWSLEEARGRALDEIFRVVHASTRRPLRFPQIQGYRDFGELTENLVLANRNGAEIPVEVTSAAIRNDQDEGIGMVLVFRDVTERLRAETVLFEQKEKLRITLASIGDAVLTTDAGGRIDSINAHAEQMTGWSEREARGRQIDEVLPIFDQNTRAPDSPAMRCMEERRIIQHPDGALLRCRDGREMIVDKSAGPIIDARGTVLGAVVVLRDVTEQRLRTQQISYQASHDALTELINRKEFERRLLLLLEHAKRQQRVHALCYLDLDQFKVVNDTCGHVAGDELLRRIAALIKTKIRERDTFARLGGDEFGILLGECPLDQAQRIASEILDTVREFRFAWEDKIFSLGVSIGIVPIDETSTSFANLLSDADRACYAAKVAGGNRVHEFKVGERTREFRREEIEWVSGLLRALEEERFHLYQQAIVPLKPNGAAVAHFECLLRLADDKGQLLLPGAFMHAAERYRQMLVIDEWVVQRALKHLDSLQQRAAHAIYAVNISGQSLARPEFLEFVVQQIKTHGLATNSLCFEFTESSAINNLNATQAFIATLKPLGCSFALDDFGSGLSSFNYLKSLPVDYLKIDGAIINGLDRDIVDCAMVEAIQKLGSRMGIVTVAEGVDDAAIAQKLASIGIDFAQGNALGAPQPLQA